MNTNAEGGTYLDSSALVKLFVVEAETSALVFHLRGRAGLAQVLWRVEVVRSVRKAAAGQVAAVRRALEKLSLVPLDDPLLRAAADLQDQQLCSLDAIHLAAALLLGDELTS